MPLLRTAGAPFPCAASPPGAGPVEPEGDALLEKAEAAAAPHLHVFEKKKHYALTHHSTTIFPDATIHDLSGYALGPELGRGA